MRPYPKEGDEVPKYRNVSVNFWTDPKVADDFTPEDKYGYLYCLTNPHTNLCGCYEISFRQIANETGYNTDSVERLIKRLDTVHNVIRYNAATKEILILNWSRFNWTGSDKINKPLLEEIQGVKCDGFRGYLANLYNQRSNIPTPYKPDAGPPRQKVERHRYGEYGWVRLSDDEYSRLLADLGEDELLRCIAYVDEAAQSTGNKNKWKDWNLVIRKCSKSQWGKAREPGQRPSTSASAMDDLKRLHQMYEETGT